MAKPKSKPEHRVAITADLHFAEQPRLSLPDPEYTTTRLRQKCDCLRWIAAESVNRGCETLYILGDVFDSRTEITLPVLDAVCMVFGEISVELAITVVVGNHDSYLRNPRITSLRTLPATIISAPRAEIGDGVVMVPWTDDPAELERDVENAVSTGMNYLFSHCLVKGAAPGGAGVDPSVLQPDKFKRVYLGDVHTPGTVAGAGGIRYVGSPMQHDYRDGMCDRGFVVLDTVNDTEEFVVYKGAPRFHVMCSKADMQRVQTGDFVRVMEDATPEARTLVQLLRSGMGLRVEDLSAPAPELDLTARLEFKRGQSVAEALEGYVAMTGAADGKALLKLGREILEEAGHAR